MLVGQREKQKTKSVVTDGGKGYEGNRQLLFEGTQGPGKGGFSEEVTVGLRSECEEPANQRAGKGCSG